MIYFVSCSLRILVLAVVVSLVAEPARADEGAWFEPKAAPSGAPPPSAVTAPAAPPDSLAPSPLLDEGGAPAGEAEVNDQNPEALSRFRPYLDPYGGWADDPSYGRVWVPAPNVVGPGFQPYVSNGRWALDEGSNWVWVSDYPFGWVVFHYGRWVWIGSRGWAWVPGYRYAPAWVVWRVPSGPHAYVGWAPAPPSFVWFGGYAVYYGYAPVYPWVFCPSAYVFSYRMHHHVVRDRYWMTYAARHTRPYYPASPRRRSVAHPVVAPQSPSLGAARVPPSALPRERISSRQAVSPPSRAASPDFARPSDVRSDRRHPAVVQHGSTAALRDKPARVRPDPAFRERNVGAAPVREMRRHPLKPNSGARPDFRPSPGSRRPQRR